MKNQFLLFLSLIASFSAFAQTKEAAVANTMNERYEVAADQFRKLIAANPTNGELFYFAGENYFASGSIDSAEVMFRRGQEVTPNYPLNYVGLGSVGYVNSNMTLSDAQFQKAIDMMNTKSLKIDKKTQGFAYMKMAEVYIHSEKKNLPKALEYLNKSIELDDKNPEAFVQFGDYYAEVDMIDLSKAYTQYTKALQIDPKYTRALIREGAGYVRGKNWDGGLNYFNQCIEIDPNFAPAYREKAELLFKAGRTEQAVESYAKYLELNNNCRVQQRYASFIFETKNYQKAITELEKALPCNPENPFMYRLLGYSYLETNQPQKGLENMDKFFEMATAKGSPKILASDYAYKGKLLAKAGQDSLGIATILQAVEMDPTYTDGYNDIAGLYIKARNYAKASEYYKMKINATEGEPNALDHYYLGQSLYFSKDFAGADSAFAVASTKYPDSNFWRGRANVRLDDPENPVGLAAPFFAEYIKLFGADEASTQANKKNLVEAYSYFGLLYLKHNQIDCSRYAWNKVLELDPENEKAKVAMEDKEIAASEGMCETFGTVVTPEVAPEK